MKKNLLSLLLFISIYTAKAQTPQRHISFKSIDNDSVSFPLSDEYYLIEDSCAQIIRHTRFNFTTKKFYGRFTDVSKTNPDLVVAQGTYSAEGLKTGAFITYYLNGKLQAKGNFKEDKYDGRWEMYYNDGKPELTFEVTDGDYHIIDSWKPDGSKIVDNGNGEYVDDLGTLYWKGKLVNGKPDGKWKLIRKDDITNTPMETEYFKKGQFHDGTMGDNNYTNASRITLVDPNKLPFVNIEKMYISPVACNEAKQKHVVNAQYREGLGAFSGYISQAVSPYLGKVDLRGIDNEIEINGEISETGNLINLKNNGSFREDISRGIIIRLEGLPSLHPATVDGKPVKQKFTITFKISDGIYRFSYRFLPIEAN